MAHLNSSEMLKCMDSLFTSLFGSELYMRWRKLKMRLMFSDEREFISCILGVVENQMLSIDKLKHSPHGHSSEKGNTQYIKDEEPTTVAASADEKLLSSCSKDIDNMPVHIKEEMVFDIDSDFDDYDNEEGDFSNSDVIKVDVSSAQNDGADNDENVEAIVDDCQIGDKVNNQPVLLDAVVGVETRDSECSDGEMNGIVSTDDDYSMLQVDAGVAGMSSEVGPHHCSLCSASFPRKASLVRHTSTVHMKNDQYKCSVCPQSFFSRADKIRHEQSVHADQIKTYECSVCTKIFVSEKSMIRHQEHVHFKLRKYECTFCGRCFAESWIMRKHVNRVHHNMRYEFPCVHCTREFATKHELRVHLARVHLHL